MPYISQERRNALAFQGFTKQPVATAGELNYVITMLLREYWELHEQNYQTINDIAGALEGAKLEFYRRIAVPYEEKKKVLNGDVYL